MKVMLALTLLACVALLTDGMPQKQDKYEDLLKILEKAISEKGGHSKSSKSKSKSKSHRSSHVNEPDWEDQAGVEDQDEIPAPPEMLPYLRKVKAYLKEACDIDLMTYLGSRTPIQADDIRSVMLELKGHSQSLVDDLATSETHLTDIANKLADDATPMSDLVEAHTNLVTTFNDSLNTVEKNSECTFGQVIAMRLQMEFFGSQGFAGLGTCQTTAALMYDVFNEHDDDFSQVKASMTLDKVHEFGQALRNDIQCIIEDFKFFHQYVVDSCDMPATMKARHVALVLDSIFSYATDIGLEARLLVQMAQVVHVIIPDTLLQSKNAHPIPLNSIEWKMAKLAKLLEDIRLHKVSHRSK